MTRLANGSLVQEVLEITHGRYEAIGKGGHVAHPGALGGLVHLQRLGIGHAELFFDLFQTTCPSDAPGQDEWNRYVGRGTWTR